MKCFFHENKDSVAACQTCGKGLCKPCASKYKICLCDSCYADMTAEAKKDVKRVLSNTREDFAYSIFLGVVFVVAAFFLFRNTLLGPFWDAGIGDLVFAFVLFIVPYFFVPYGWRVVSYFTNWIWIVIIVLPGFLGIVALVAFVIAKVLISIPLGVPAFIFLVYRYHRDSKQLKDIQDALGDDNASDDNQ